MADGSAVYVEDSMFDTKHPFRVHNGVDDEVRASIEAGISARLKSVRERALGEGRRATLSSLAEAAGVSERTITRRFAEPRNIKADEAERIVESLSTSIGYLRGTRVDTRWTPDSDEPVPPAQIARWYGLLRERERRMVARLVYDALRQDLEGSTWGGLLKRGTTWDDLRQFTHGDVGPAADK